MSNTKDSIEDLVTALSSKKKVQDALTGGVGTLTKNANYGDKATKETVKPEDLSKNFRDAQEFNFEMSRQYPKQAYVIETVRRSLKLLHFDLANLTQDVKLQAETTKDNLQRAKSKLFLRKKIEGLNKLSAKLDRKIWEYEVKTLIADLELSLKELTKIVTDVTKL